MTYMEIFSYTFDLTSKRGKSGVKERFPFWGLVTVGIFVPPKKVSFYITMFSIAIYINLPFLLFFPTPWVSQCVTVRLGGWEKTTFISIRNGCNFLWLCNEFTTICG